MAMFELFFLECCANLIPACDVQPARSEIGREGENPVNGEAIGSYRRDPLYHASLDPSDDEALLADGGFELIEHSINDPAKGSRIFWLARAVPSG